MWIHNCLFYIIFCFILSDVILAGNLPHLRIVYADLVSQHGATIQMYDIAKTIFFNTRRHTHINIPSVNNDTTYTCPHIHDCTVQQLYQYK